MESKSKTVIYLPIALAIAIIGGIYLGLELRIPEGNNYRKEFDVSNRTFNKINEVLNYIEHEYVDTVNRRGLEEKIIQYALQELDPHSFYISAADLQAMNEPLEGNFEGVGIEFSIQSDTLMVIAAISGGPSEKVGMRAGDRIVKVDGNAVAGVGLTNKRVVQLLRGKGGTKVICEVVRRNVTEPITFEITRDKIPIHSVEVAYMIEPEVGFVKVARFAKTTSDEFNDAARKLLDLGMKRMILDLRGNGGGYMDAAIKMSDHYLDPDRLIVYTEGKARSRRDYYSTDNGVLIGVPVAVLIDEGSASASEIVSGAIQDNDRGIIVGRRSFGKGLVQEPSGWPDGSSIRLTIARYYTPTGRCIQKPYGDNKRDYHMEYYKRLESGELMSMDSVDFPDSLKFLTPNGKIVYGGGGITPDYFVPIDTAGRSYYLTELIYSGILRKFAFEYADKHREELNSYETVGEMKKKFNVDVIVQELYNFAEQEGLRKNEYGIIRSKVIIENRLKASIMRNIWKSEGYYCVVLEDDVVVKKAVQELSN